MGVRPGMCPRVSRVRPTDFMGEALEIREMLVKTGTFV